MRGPRDRPRHRVNFSSVPSRFVPFRQNVKLTSEREKGQSYCARNSILEPTAARTKEGQKVPLFLGNAESPFASASRSGKAGTRPSLPYTCCCVRTTRKPNGSPNKDSFQCAHDALFALPLVRGRIFGRPCEIPYISLMYINGKRVKICALRTIRVGKSGITRRSLFPLRTRVTYLANTARSVSNTGKRYRTHASLGFSHDYTITAYKEIRVHTRGDYILHSFYSDSHFGLPKRE